jgi:hypothetical protein
MNAVVCLGGTHLCSEVHGAVNQELHRAAQTHYILVLQSLRSTLSESGGSILGRSSTVGVLLTVALLCEIEVR